MNFKQLESVKGAVESGVKNLLGKVNLTVDNKMESQNSTDAECSNVDTSNVNSINWPNVANWINGGEMFDSNLPITLDKNFEPLPTAKTTQVQIDTETVNQADFLITTGPQIDSLELVRKLTEVESNLDSLASSSDSSDVDEVDSWAELKTPPSGGPNDDIEQSILALSNRFDKCSPAELLPDLISLMSDQLENVGVQMSCHRLINQYLMEQLRQLKVPLERRLIEVLLLSVQLHCHYSVAVEGFCDLLLKINVDQGDIDSYLGPIDCILETLCDDIKLTKSAKRSALKLFREVACKSDESETNLIGQIGFVEKICRAIRLQLDKSEYDEILEISWNCLFQICWNSVENQKRFANSGATSLFQQCYRMFSDQTELVYQMTYMLSCVTDESSIRYLMTRANLKVLWAIWTETEDNLTSTNCCWIFANFLFNKTYWHKNGHPTIAEVKLKLGW